MRNEADTRAELIEPKLIDRNWKGEKIKREIFITAGKIINEYGKRQKRKRADYILYYKPSLPIAVVEAKEEGKTALDGMGQAKDYAQMLGCLFAYSTNGHQIEEFDFTTNRQETLDTFPTPEELFKRYMEFTFKQMKDIKPLTLDYYTKHDKIPRYYQEKAIKQVLEAIIQGQNRILLTMATGTGKTFTAFQIVWLLLKSKYFKKILYLADRNFLRNQA
jgi:type I restriction enzyme R subunit